LLAAGMAHSQELFHVTKVSNNGRLTVVHGHTAKVSYELQCEAPDDVPCMSATAGATYAAYFTGDSAFWKPSKEELRERGTGTHKWSSYLITRQEER